jgi:predicted nucleic acid-binding protein
MKVWADSSLMVRMLTPEAGTAAVRVALRKLKHPRLFFTPLHELEVVNALRVKFALASREVPARQRPALERQLGFALARLEAGRSRGVFVETAMDWPSAIAAALELSEQHAARITPRAFDILHVAGAQELHCDHFLTCDLRQAVLAKAAGFKVTCVEVEA